MAVILNRRRKSQCCSVNGCGGVPRHSFRSRGRFLLQGGRTRKPDLYPSGMFDLGAIAQRPSKKESAASDLPQATGAAAGKGFAVKSRKTLHPKRPERNDSPLDKCQ